MPQKTADKLNQKISSLKNEMKILRSFIIGMTGKDKEGEYRPEFAKKILKLSKKKGGFTFKNAEDFLAQIKKTQ